MRPLAPLGHERLDPVLVAGPAADPVTLAELKQHVRVDHDDDDAHLRICLAAAVARVDGWSGILRRGLVTQTWSESFRYFYGRRIWLRLAPVQSIASVIYFDLDGVERTVDAADYRLQVRNGEGYLELDDDASWPSVDARDDAVTITYVVGYGDAASDVPAPIRSAILITAADLYEQRETNVIGASVAQWGGSATVDALLGSYRRGHI